MGYLEQYGTLIVALMLGGGFAFGGIASYAGIVGGGSSNTNTQDQANVTLPSKKYVEGGFDRELRVQRYLAYREDVVFTTVYYQDEEGLETARGLKTLHETFGDRLYIAAANASKHQVPLSESRIEGYPLAVLLGGNQNSPTAVVNDVSSAKVGSAACKVIRDLGDLAAYCTTN
ncbi:MAG: hypothetical protein ABEJ69_02475 [Candidatus Nanohaloarchaea archaeon]